jgi:hypothetical protein
MLTYAGVCWRVLTYISPWASSAPPHVLAAATWGSAHTATAGTSRGGGVDGEGEGGGGWGGGGQNGACEAPVSGIVAASGVLGVHPTTLLHRLSCCFLAAFLLLSYCFTDSERRSRRAAAAAAAASAPAHVGKCADVC